MLRRDNDADGVEEQTVSNKKTKEELLVSVETIVDDFTYNKIIVQRRGITKNEGK